MNTQGIGLGLVISENIVQAFEGQIGVQSKFGVGTIFAFSIPLGREKHDSIEVSGGPLRSMRTMILASQAGNMASMRQPTFCESIVQTSTNQQIPLTETKSRSFVNSFMMGSPPHMVSQLAQVAEASRQHDPDRCDIQVRQLMSSPEPMSSLPTENAGNNQQEKTTQ